jgi:hypothetical protein
MASDHRTFYRLSSENTVFSVSHKGKVASMMKAVGQAPIPIAALSEPTITPTRLSCIQHLLILLCVSLPFIGV